MSYYEEVDYMSRGNPVVIVERPVVSRGGYDYIDRGSKEKYYYDDAARRSDLHSDDESDEYHRHDRHRHHRHRERSQPRLLRRQSSLDSTFGRINISSSRRHHDIPRIAVFPPSQPEDDDDIRIAESGEDEDEHRAEENDFFEREVEPYPRRGKTRFPKRHVHVSAIIELGYPFQEEVCIYFSPLYHH